MNHYCENDYTAKYNLQIQCHLYQIINGIFHRTRTPQKKKNSHLVWKHKRPQRAQANWRKKNGAQGINLPDFRLYLNATVIKIV